MTVRRLFVLTAVAALALGLLAAPGAAQDGAVDITILHDTHLHGQFGDLDLTACPEEVDDSGFTDIAGSTFERSINCAAAQGLTVGLSGDEPRFGPSLVEVRPRIATFLARALDTAGVDLPSVEEPRFADVSGSVHAESIEQLAELGVVRGEAETRFGRGEVRRDQFASMLVQAVEAATGQELEPQTRDHFPDTAGSVHADNIDVAFELGIFQGRADGTFGPRRAINRGQIAATILPALQYASDNVPRENLARYSTLVNELKAEHDNALFVGNGDELAPGLFASLFRGAHMVEALNATTLDVTTMGNHEFDYGPENFREQIADSEFPWVTANVLDADGDTFGADLGVEPFLTWDFDGVTVGVTGLAPEGMASITSLGDNQRIGSDEALDEVVPQMEAAGVDVVVVASHLCSDDARTLAQSRDDIHVVVGDHCSEVMEQGPEFINGTIVHFVGDEYALLGQIDLTVTDGEVTDWDWEQHALGEMVIAPDPAVQPIVEDYEAQLDEELNQVIGERSVTWDTRVEVVRTRETGIGNFIADEMRAFYDTDIAVQNSGGIRGNQEFPPGDVTRRDVVEILPFENYVVAADIDGATLREALEHSVHGVGDGVGRFLQVSGIEFTYDASRDPFDRVVDVEINGEPLDPDGTYSMASNDFTMGGGDDFDMFADLELTSDPNAAPLLSQLIIDAVEARGTPVDTDVEGRITRLDEAD